MGFARGDLVNRYIRRVHGQDVNIVKRKSPTKYANFLSTPIIPFQTLDIKSNLKTKRRILLQFLLKYNLTTSLAAGGLALGLLVRGVGDDRGRGLLKSNLGLGVYRTSGYGGIELSKV